MNLINYLVDSKDSLLQALRKIDINQKGFVLVIDNEKGLIGTVTDGDIRRSLIKGIMLDTSVENVCNKNFKYILNSDSFETVVKSFQEKKVEFLPILDNEKKVINIITKKQLHAFMLNDLKWNYSLDFSEMDKKELVYEIYNRPWGYFKTVLLSDFAQAKILCVYPKGKLSLQEHKFREEHWVIIKGNGRMTIGDSQKLLNEGDYIYIPKGCKHTIENISDNNNLYISEVQLGTYFGEDDIIRYEDIYNRI